MGDFPSLRELSNYHLVFDPVSVFRVLYRDVIYRVYNDRVMAFEESSDVILRSGFIQLIENHLLKYFR